MSVCGQNGQTEDESASEDVVASARDTYKQKPVSKVVRVLTVLAYLLSVSLAAILLSVYYVCVWKSPTQSLVNGTEISARLMSPQNLSDIAGILDNGGSDTPVSDVITEPSTSNNATVYNTNATVASIFYNSTYDPTALPDTTQLESNSNLIFNNSGAFNETDNVT